MDVLVQIVLDIGICVNDLVHVLRAHLGLHPCRRACHKAFCLELVRVQQIADERFGIIWLVRDVRDDEHSRLGSKALQSGSI